MGLEYKIQVLHYLNPHLIWVEVLNTGDDKLYFEQIGIYGVLPMNTVIDEKDAVFMERCEDWVPAATNTMKRLLSKAVEVWFCPTYIYRRTSIFDDNTQKFGDIIIKTKKGHEISLSEELIESSFAIHDECAFHKELSNGTIKTKLNYITTQQVIKILENSFKREDISKKNWIENLKAQTSVFQMAVELENSVLSRKLPHKNADMKHLMKKKMKDLEYCKDVNEDSVGRGSMRMAINSSVPNRTTSAALKKKLNLVKQKDKSPLEDKSVTVAPINDSFNKYMQEDPIRELSVSAKNHVKNNHSVEKAKTPTKKTKEPDVPVKRIAFGPPGMNPTKMTLKPVPQEPEDELPKPIYEVKVLETGDENVTETKDMYEKVDSEVDLKITNLDVLKMSVKDTPTNHIAYLSPPKNENGKSKQGAGILQRKMQILQKKMSNKDTETTGLANKSIVESKNYLDSDDESISDIVEKLNLSNTSFKKDVDDTIEVATTDNLKNNVNPFKNIDGSHSVFVDKLVSPILMVHTKKNNRIQTTTNMRDIPFGSDIHIVLRNMSITNPMILQTISWHSILRGHSVFLISPYASGKTMGYLPSVCRSVADNKDISDGFGPSCIIICGTSKSVSDVESICKMFLHDVRVFACYAGMNEMVITTSLLNGCDLLIATPCMLVRLIQKDFGVDLRNLSTLVLDDCERSTDIYPNELKFALLKIKEMLKVRGDKAKKVQYVVASRLWCDFMSSLAKRVPDLVICIGAFQECVLYSKASTSVNFLKIENKLTAVLDFLKNTDRSKKTVIACRSDGEVLKLERALTELKYVVFSCDSTMTLHDLYKLDLALAEYEEPVSGPILVCCDGNLTHLNVTNAHYLIHYSLPELFSMFCKRFSVLNDNYPSIFDNQEGNVKIKILLDDTNVEQLPKILNFIQRCTDDVPVVLDNISKNVLVEKDLKKAKALVPICGNLLASGKCPDLWNCNERHGIFKEYDEPKDWIPNTGVITFRILHYHTAISYSARLLTNINDGSTKKYPQNYSLLTFKMGLYYSKESNKKPHGVPAIGDICAVALKQNLFERCQVMKILKYSRKGTPELVLIKLLDEEKYEQTRDVYLYHLPDELKNVETHVVRIILSNIQPDDRDVTFSELAKDQLKKITDKDEDLYLRGKVALVIGNIVFVDTLEACQELSSLNEVVVKDDLKKELLNGHAIPNLEHINTLKKLYGEITKNKEVKIVEIPKPIKILPKGRWAHFDSDDFTSVFYAYADSPGKFYIRLVKFKDCINSLLSDIKKYIADAPETLDDVIVGDIVLAKFPDDDTYERARIDRIVDDKKVECFFVDQGDLKEVYIKDLVSITERFITQLPFQGIECCLRGIQPPGEDWTEFSTNWFIDACFDSSNQLKYLFAKYFDKQKAESTEGNKYSVVLIDTYSEKDVVINQLMIDLNLARETENVGCLNEINFKREEPKKSDDDSDEEIVASNGKGSNIAEKPCTEHILFAEPKRSVPLVETDSDSSSTWEANKIEDFLPMFNIQPSQRPNTTKDDKTPKTTKENDKKTNLKMLPPPKASSTLDSDDLSSISSGVKSETSNTQTEDLRKPKLCWRQNKTHIAIKIQLIGVENYQMVIKERCLKFFCVLDDVKFGFEFDLYGGVDCGRSSHSNRGQYILVSLCKVMKRNWLTLTKGTGVFKWIVYDVDAIETSSDEEEILDDKNIKGIVKTKNDFDTDSDDDFVDDANYSHKSYTRVF